MRRPSWQDLVNVGLGLWIFVSAAFLRHAMTDATWWHSMVGAPPPEGVSGAAMWNLIIVGAAVVAFALFAALAFNAWQEWVNMALGIWLLISPWVLVFHASEALRWNSVIVGVLIAALAAWVLVQERAKADQKRAAGNRYGSKTLR
jgi:hypothetical protein